MPWEIVKQEGKFYVVKKGTNERKNKIGYKSRADAVDYLKALYANTAGELLTKNE